ncbi:MAG: pyrimidine reductase family protein [Acidimicrobiales bacterium]|nr:MAG: pyrimidine reductase family protein [Acidimicrobiales bacterium]
MRRLFPEPVKEVDLRSCYVVPREQGPVVPANLVRANMVTSLDGAAAVGGRVGPLSNPVDLGLLHLLRSLADVVLAGAETVRAEHYRPVRLSDAERRERRVAGQAEVPPIAVITRTGTLDLQSPFFSQAEARPIVLTTHAMSLERRRAVETVAEVVVAGADSVDLSVALGALRARGLGHVLCEGGPRVLTQLVEADLLDELCLTVSPRLAGRQPVHLGARATLEAPKQLNLVSVLEDQGFLYLRYARQPVP